MVRSDLGAEDWVRAGEFGLAGQSEGADDTLFSMNALGESHKIGDADRRVWFHFGLPFYIGLCFLSGLLAVTIYDPDILEFLYLVVAVPIVGIFLWAYSSYNKGTKGRSALVMFFICCFMSWFIAKNGFNVRSEARWLVGVKTYKREVLSRASSPEGSLKHMEWDRWGWAGIGNTVIYLVFDPTDQLATPDKNQPQRYKGIPCQVPSVHRLENHWYTVVFYTDTDWENCA